MFAEGHPGNEQDANSLIGVRDQLNRVVLKIVNCNHLLNQDFLGEIYWALASTLDTN